ncbi:MAG: hypothetical protein US83_C0004G0097 [Candidatus Falkowbacteria bacterium GW2011_GWC2_38_22]|uniref:ParB/Sulfiredoxin domain-containing protein n=1 Tax=Candidatus Falkowbacteria bacterium GW2011_GWE1_38_31 TaxID=1618638 RepID=A0A0G0K4Z7_9BACT|nr:MAG: hypothetical protein US73_C0002G0020 [Candidatus Falkowbacteria bacterium GW2011_GWF2_38_1205]KKQ61713.1 MAG: hypothetical protein US83_C0004G0097 [Candidatus Falkowbacteria bacterium GW2011_GWC2_38_22]KKQ63672.1 MAG: hypothetical protein US84_C0004G0020 [Candidatus Falkowbacteria bacterium GW2011_GWF1_38_22]KKQ65912.1 MAG: hypothetical protein US87_C0004G0097 [Candidatus Falkowbacteria bacterium GW2011_GWE2_38_254]KKQ70535.1 MAG: hypothetical protein US91_C0004G0020 [Candidatus Falkowb
MDKETRIKKIGEVIKQEPFGNQEIPWQDKLESMDVFKIPLDCLVYNKYNGRILSRTKSLERKKYEINVETEEGTKLIEKLLLESNEGRNKKTLESLKKIGQQKIGIVTRDGIIIDGNRRAMLLRVAKCDYFKAVVLPVTLEENPIEIEKLETSFQMGEDEKLSYNATEKYLKVKGLRQRGVSIDKIADWMGETEPTVKSWLDIMEIMDDYLDYLEYNGIYTQLDDREGQFVDLTNLLKKFTNGSKDSADAFDGYKPSDVDDLIMISFDYIRAKYEGKKFRNIAYGRKKNHFFGDEKIWKNFKDFHFENVEPIKEKEEKIDYDSEKLEAHLNGRDEKYAKEAIGLLNDNIEVHQQQLRNRQAADEPAKLVNSAKNALESINQRHKAFAEPEVMKVVLDLNNMTTNMLGDKSPENTLDHVIYLLERLNIKKESKQSDAILEKIRDINKILFDIKKGLGG